MIKLSIKLFVAFSLIVALAGVRHPEITAQTKGLTIVGESDLEDSEGSLEVDDFGFEDEEGLSDSDLDLEGLDSSSIDDSIMVFGGFFEEQIDYSHAYEDPEFSKIKSTLNLKFDFKFTPSLRAKLHWNGFYDYSYQRRGRDKFTDETLETYETESELRETFVDVDLLDWIRLMVGRQYIVWGQSDTAQITDVGNPRDMRELGMVDLEDARLPVVATKLSLLFGSIEFNAAAIHEMRGNKIASKGSEFDLYQSVRALGINIEDEEIPDSTVENTEYMLRFFKTFNGGDLGIMWADVYDDSSYLDFKKLEINVPTSSNQLTVVPKHKRIKVFGVSGVIVRNSWLLKTEIAKKSDVAFLRSDIKDQLTTLYLQAVSSSLLTVTYNEDSNIVDTWIEKDVLHSMLGIEYTGFDDLTISVESVTERIEDYDKTILSDELTSQLTLVVSHTALNNALDTQFFWIHFLRNNGDVYRFNIAFDISDDFTISGGFINYETNDDEASVYNFRDNDRVFVAFKYNF